MLRGALGSLSSKTTKPVVLIVDLFAHTGDLALAVLKEKFNPGMSIHLHYLGFHASEMEAMVFVRELDVMRVWFLRAFVVFFLDFVMFSQSFHGYSLDMFLCSCFLNKTNFSC